METRVKAIYEPFSPEELSRGEWPYLTPADIAWKGEIHLLFQTIENLRLRCPITGATGISRGLPHTGRLRVVNQAFIDYLAGARRRPYDGWL